MTRARIAPPALFALLLCIHAAALWSQYPNARGPITNEPLIEQDYAQHFHHVMSARRFWEQDRRLSGYNPFFLGGYVSNTIQDASIKLPEITAAVLTPLDPILVFNIMVFLMAALTPLALAAGFWGIYSAMQIGTPSWCAVGAAALGTVAWWNGYAREMFFYGMIGWPAGCALGIACLGLWLRRIKRGFPPAPHSRAAAILDLAPLALVAILLPAVHLQAAVYVASVTCVLLAFHPARANPKRWAELALFALLAALVNSPWLLPMLRYAGGSSFGKIAREFAFFASDDPLTFAKAYLPWGSYFSFRSNPWPPIFRLALLLLACLGVIWALVLRTKRVGRVCNPTKVAEDQNLATEPLKPLALSAHISVAAIATVTYILTYFGSFIGPLRAMQPLRFEVLLDLLLTPLAFVALISIMAPSRLWRALILLITFAGLTAAIANIGITERSGDMRARTGLTGPQKAIVEWIARNTPRDFRVLFEESGDETGFIYGGTYLSAFIPHLTGRSLIGGPANFYNDPAGDTNFHSGILLGRRIDEWSPQQFTAVLSRYNVGAIVCFTPRTLELLAKLDGIVIPDGAVGPVSFFTVAGAHSMVALGDAKVRSGLNEIEISGARGERLVLRMHWAEGLVIDPPADLRPTIVEGDSIPFIEVLHPPTQFLIKLK